VRAGKQTGCEYHCLDRSLHVSYVNEECNTSSKVYTITGSPRLIGLLTECIEIPEFYMNDGNLCDIFKILSCVSYKCFCLQAFFQSFAGPPSPVVVQSVRSHSTCGFSGFLSGVAEDSVLGSDVA
jgi:hypothetical protein